jgi:hypothetical protein
MIHQDLEAYKFLVHEVDGAWMEIELWVIVSRIRPKGKRCLCLPFQSGITFDFPNMRKLENRVASEQSYQIKNSQMRERFTLTGINGN